MWAYVRANRVRFALLSAAGVGVATAAVYGRRYYSAFQRVLAEEREAGTRALRAKYVANSYVTEAAAAALLPLVKAKIPSPHALVVAMRAGDKNNNNNNMKKNKVQRWEEIRDTTLVMLAASAAAIASLYVALVLATNLCREEDFDEYIRQKIIVSAIAESTQCLEERALVVGKSIPLKKKLTKGDVREVAENMLRDQRLKLMDENWLFNADSDNDNTDVVTMEVRDRLNEALDLANTLQYRSTVLDATHHVLDCILDRIKPEEWNRPCAHLLNSIQQAANHTLNNLPQSLRNLPSVEKFGVSVFLSVGSSSAISPPSPLGI